MSSSVLSYPAPETAAALTRAERVSEIAARAAAGERGRASGSVAALPATVAAVPAAEQAPTGAQALDFDEVYQEHAQFVWRSLARLGVPQDQLPDALQDVFVVVCRRLPDFEHRSSVKTWLFGILVRVVSERWRKARRRPTVPLPEALADTRAPSPEQRAVRSEAVSMLYELLGGLSAEQRAAFVLAELEQMTIPEIAQAVGSNVHTIKSRLRTARRQFEAALRRHQARNEWRKS